MTLQCEMPLKIQLFRPPLVDVRGAFATLRDASESEVLALCEYGYVWAWNIGDQRSRRQEVRILEASLLALAALDWRAALNSQNPARRSPRRWVDVLAVLLANVPEHRPWLSGKECRRVLNCGRQHLLDLIVATDLRATTYRRGPGGSPNIDRQEFTRFLEARVIGGL